MAPVCRPFGPWAHVNRMMHYDSWLASYHEAAPLAQFCGRVALMQLEAGRHFFNENPKGSEIYLEPPWNIVLQWPGVVQQDFDQCMTGLRAINNMLVKKPTRATASHRALVHYFRDLLCDGSHPHQQLAGGGHASRAQVWTWDFATRVILGVILLRKVIERERGYQPAPAFPSVASGPGDDDAAPDGDQPPWYDCPGCRRHQRADDPRHNRVPGVCKFPLTQTVDWECEGCRGHAPRHSNRHNYEVGRCKWATAPTKSGGSRAGRHPRPGRRPADDEPTANLPGPHLGEDDEAEAARAEQAERALRQEPSSSSSSSSSAAAGSQDPPGQPAAPGEPARP